MKRFRMLAALLAVVVLTALATVIATSKHGARAAYASTGCTDATLTGNYAFTLSGFQNPSKASVSNESVLPVAAGVVQTFDGAGNTSANYTISFTGKILAGQTSSGTYSVNSDCTGTLSFTTGDAAGFTENLVIIGGGAEVFGIATVPGTAETIDFKKQ